MVNVGYAHFAFDYATNEIDEEIELQRKLEEDVLIIPFPSLNSLIPVSYNYEYLQRKVSAYGYYNIFNKLLGRYGEKR